MEKLTNDELEVASMYLFKKAIRLEEAGLTDSKCYPLLYSVYLKMTRELNERKKENGTDKIH